MLKIQRVALDISLARGVEARSHRYAENGQADEYQCGADDDELAARAAYVHAHARAGAVVYKEVPVAWVVVEHAPEPEVVLVHHVAARPGGQPLLRVADGELGRHTEGDERCHKRKGQNHRPQVAVAHEPVGEAEDGRHVGSAQQHFEPVVAPHARERRVQIAVVAGHVGALAVDERVEQHTDHAHQRKGDREDDPANAFALADVGGQSEYAGRERDQDRRHEQSALYGLGRLGCGLEIDDDPARVRRRPVLGLFQLAELFVRADVYGVGHDYHGYEHHAHHADGHALAGQEVERHPGRRLYQHPQPLRALEAPGYIQHPRVAPGAVGQRRAEDDALLGLGLVAHHPRQQRHDRPDKQEENHFKHCFRPLLRGKCPGTARQTRPRPCRSGAPRRQ